jgi:hypothetical protein
MKGNANWECYVSLSPRKYAGQYVVISGGRLVGAGKKLRPLMQRARRLHPKEVPLVARMRDPRKVCVY